MPSPAAQAAPALAPGTILAERYEVVRQLGVGGFGSVYEAADRTLERRVAVKVPLVDSPTRLERFLQEARILAAMSNEHIVRVLDVARGPEGAPLIVMELLD